MQCTAPHPTLLSLAQPHGAVSSPSPSPGIDDRTERTSMDSDTGAAKPVTTPPSVKAKKTPTSGREDCWSAEATWTLIEAWGERYVDLNRGNLRQKHWQEVADAVNAEHSSGAGGGKSYRSDVQCKNRIDTLKKKYKIEKARVSGSNGDYTSSWPFFSRLDFLIGSVVSLAKRPATSPAIAGRSCRNPSPPSWAQHALVPVARRSATVKRPAPDISPATQPPTDRSGSGRSFSAFAAAVTAMQEDEESESEPDSWSRPRRNCKPSRGAAMLEELAEAIERFGETYERVERAKQRQIVEVEKQRMQFAKDLEYQRMRLFMETQAQIHNPKRTKRASSDNYS